MDFRGLRSKALQVTGALALVALVTGAFAALAIVRERVDITIEGSVAGDGEARRGPDPLDLLRADTAELREDVTMLSDALAKSSTPPRSSLSANRVGTGVSCHCRSV